MWSYSEQCGFTVKGHDIMTVRYNYEVKYETDQNGFFNHCFLGKETYEYIYKNIVDIGISRSCERETRCM